MKKNVFFTYSTSIGLFLFDQYISIDDLLYSKLRQWEILINPLYHIWKPFFYQIVETRFQIT